jgi:hypothetical protein
VARPITLKKDGIQTRNRKLAAKAKSKKTLADFSRFSSYTSGGTTTGSSYMSQYFSNQNFGQMTYPAMGHHHHHHALTPNFTSGAFFGTSTA